MKKLLCAALVAVSTLCAVAADATVYYLNGKAASANNSNAGTSVLAPWKTMAKPNTALRPGDVLRVYPGSYASPSPDSAGSNPTGGGYITYIGTHVTADPLSDSLARALIIFNTEGPDKPYVSIKGVTWLQSLHLGNHSHRDSVRACLVYQDLEIDGADYNVVAECKFLGPHVSIGRGNPKNTNRRNKIIGCHFDRLGYGITGADTEHFWMQGYNGTNGTSDPNCYVDSLQVLFCRAEFYGLAGTGEHRCGPTLFLTKHQDSRYNRWSYHLGNGDEYVFRLRDSTLVNTFKDTIITFGSMGGHVFASTSGSQGRNSSRPNVAGNVWDSCFVNTTQSAPVDFYFYDGMVDCSVTNTTIAARNHALLIPFVRGRNVVTSNTLASDGTDGIVNMLPVGGSLAWGDTAMTFASNELYAFAKTSGPMPDQSNGSLACGLLVASAAFDSGTAMRQQNNFVCKENGYAVYGRVTGSLDGARDRCILIQNGSQWVASAPGDSTAANLLGRAENRWRLDSLAFYGSPRFRDSTQALAFDPYMLFGGNAANGAVAYVEQPRLSVSTQSITFVAGAASTATFVVYNVGDGVSGAGDTCLPDARSLGLSVEAEYESIGEASVSGAFTVTYDGAGVAGTTYVDVINTHDETLPYRSTCLGTYRALRIPITILP